ncbi:hypothetical protein NMY22_g16881 [Coprinellus aureogranulatus]|nr:hypothetical protein NMY22_g16881 [Coprinellus aureogranulatus]
MPAITIRLDISKFNGSWHRIYDLTRQKVAVRFRDDEAGDAMALDAAGDRLAIVTRNSPTNSTLRIYDVRNKDPNPVQEIELEPFKLMDEDDEDEAGEHRGAQFSPDGVFIALARYDNCVHVYDSRFIKSKGLLYNFQHSAVTRINPGVAPYGVSNLEWVYKDSRLGLVSGGSDGCVRLWNPLEAASNPKNGKPLVTVNSDIATFSLGDRFKGEHQLVVGDCAGEVSIFDQFLDTDFPYR